MSRNDGLLYSGATSASFGSTRTAQAAKLADKKEAKQADKSKLLPANDVVQAELQKEIDKLKIKEPAVIKAIIGSGIPHALEIDMLSDAKAIEALRGVQARLANILRVRT